jgi:hypothetical protein
MQERFEMKKLAAFYIGWDAAVFLLLYLNSLKELWVLDYYRKTMDFNVRMWSYAVTPMLFGCLIAALVFVGTKYWSSRKAVILELILLGIPFLYIAFFPALYFLTPHYFGFSLPLLTQWLNTENGYIYGIVILGYVISAFIFKWIKIRNDRKLAAVESDKEQ